MELWIFATLVAALAQTFRFMLQKHLGATRLSAAGATFARFVYSAPLAVLLALGYSRASGLQLPEVPAQFWPYALAGGTAQILATVCVVALFARRNFAVGITLKKTEVLMSVLVGLIVLGDGVSLGGLAAILLGFAGVLLLSDLPEGSGPFLRRILNRSAGLGLMSGLFFGISGVGYRGASLSLASDDPLQRALITLALVTSFQLIALGLWLLWREKGEVTRVLAAWRIAALVGLTSLIGSIGWFTAFTLQTVGYVNALGQVELIFSIIATTLFFGERISAREVQGMALLTGSVIALVLVV